MVFIPLKSTVQFVSGNVSAIGTVLDVSDIAGLFVQSDRLVPVCFGRGSKFEQVKQHDKLWLRVAGAVRRGPHGCAIGFDMVE